MIDLILKPHGTYEYHWERTESGWNEIQTVLGPYANHFVSEDKASLSYWGDEREITITIYAKTDARNNVSIPRAMIEAALDIRARIGEAAWLQYTGMTITPGRDHYDETFAKFVLTYS